MPLLCAAGAQILRYLAKKWNLDVDAGDGKNDGKGGGSGGGGSGGGGGGGGAGEAKQEGPAAGGEKDEDDGLVGAYTSSLNLFAPSMQIKDVIGAWGTGGGSVISRIQDVSATEGKPANPLFWPFPSQGRPALPSGRELEEAGFVLL